MNLSRKAMLKGLSTSVLFLAAGCSPKPVARGPRDEVTFAILSTETAQNIEPLWQPFLNDMAKQTGLKIKPYFRSNYTALIEAMRFDQVQVGGFSGAAGLEAVRRADGEVFARSSDSSGMDGYKSLIITRSDSDLTAEDLLTCDGRKTFGMGDIKSVSDAMAAMTYFFLRHKVDPAKCFKSVRVAGPQANLDALVTGQVDAAIYNTAALERLGRVSPETLSQIKIIWTSPTLPEDPIVYRKDLDPATREKIRSFFLSYGTGKDAEGQRQRKVLNALLFGTFKPADNTYLLPVREMEAAEALMAAQNSGDVTAIAKAQADLAVVTKEARAVAAPPQAAPDPQ